MKRQALIIRFGLPALAVLLLGGPAQAQITTATVGGTVVDDTGPVPGASILALNIQSGFRRETTAGTDGKYQLGGLQPGTYEIKVSAQGFKEQTKTVQVLVGQTSTADFHLTLAGFTQNVTVVGEATPLLIDIRTPQVATNITQQQIEDLPINNRNFLAFAGLAPGISFTADTDAQEQVFRSGAQNPKQVNVFIDGVSYKNDIIKGGAFMQDASRGNPFPQGAVQEYQVLTQNYKAEYEKAAAAVITAVTKSGGNDFRGDVFYLFQNKAMVAQDDISRARGDEKAPYERNQYGLSLGGPIIRSRLNFFVSGERHQRDVINSVFHGSEWDKRPANVAAILDQYPTGALSSPLDEKLYFGKLSVQATPGQSAEISAHRRDEREIRDFGGQRPREGGRSFEVYTDALTVRHQLVLGGSNAINEVIGTYQKLSWHQKGIGPLTPSLNYQNLLDIGSHFYLQDLEQAKIGIRDDLSRYFRWHGDHTLKGGVVVNWADYNLTKLDTFNPRYEFRSRENWQFPYQATYGFGDPSLDFGNTQFGLYVQDDWNLKNFTVSAGVRWDYETNMLNNDWVTPPAVVNGLRTACRTYPEPVGGQTQWCIGDLFDLDNFISTGDNRSSYSGMYQPRVGVSWDPLRNAQTVVFAGWGMYYDRVTLNDIYDEQFRHSWKRYQFCFTMDGTQPEGCGAPAIQWNPSYLSAAGLDGLIASGRAGGPEVFLLANDTRPPRTIQWTAGVRHQLGKGWLGSLTYANSTGRNGMAWSFGTLPPETQFNDRWGGWIRIPGYELIMRSYDDRKTKYNALFLKLDRPKTAGVKWGGNFAYTYSKGFQNASYDEGAAFAFDFIPPNWPLFPSNGDERHRLIMSGTVELPARFQVSPIISLGSGTPYTYTDCLAGWDQCQTHFNAARPEKQSFLGQKQSFLGLKLKQFAYRSVDLRLHWEAPPVAKVARLSLIGEAFNAFNFDNNGCLDGWAGAPGEPNARFLQPTCQFNTRRYQIGARVAF
ncbi:MAG: carboxypeptidase regulatory-like domain-containing protein [Acidobacteria bacterium]|nr:carboxypeptidase regulatory-like domain-containing protein [Acidobacteriota bacterium]